MKTNVFSRFLYGIALLAIVAVVPVIAHALVINVATGGVSKVASTAVEFQASINTDYIGSLKRPVAWFEYGTSESFGMITPPREFTSRTSILREGVTGLKPNTQYFLRAVAQSTEGRINGQTTSFYTLASDGSPGGSAGGTTTSGGGTTTSGGGTGSGAGTGTGGSGGGVNINISGSGSVNNNGASGGTGQGSNNLVAGSFMSKMFLSIDDGFNSFTDQDILTYEIKAQNVSKEDQLENIYIVVELPDLIAYLGDNGRGIYRPDQHELVFDVRDLEEQEGVQIQLNVRPLVEFKEGDQLVLKVWSVYTDSANGLQYQTVDYDVNSFTFEGEAPVVSVTDEEGEPKNGLPIFLIMLIVVILVTVIVILGRKIYLKYKEDQSKENRSEDIYNTLLQSNDNNQPTRSVFDDIESSSQANHLGAENFRAPLDQDKFTNRYSGQDQPRFNTERQNEVSPPNNMPE